VKLRVLRTALLLALLVSAPAGAAVVGIWQARAGLHAGLAGGLLVVPEPATALLAGIGFLGLWAFGRVPQ
jgi:hypothetical protein